MKTLQFILIAITALTGCTKKSDLTISTTTKTDTTQTTGGSGSYTYLALGDSYTIGESVPANESYPIQLSSTLVSDGYYVQLPKIIATTGWTTGNLINAIDQDPISRSGTTYSFVTLLIGVNDQFQGLEQTAYQKNFVQLLHTAISFAGGDSSHVFVLSIPDYGVTPFAQGRESIIGPQIDQFNAINKAESLKAHVNYLDITGISRQAATNPNLIAGDGLHPSGEMYAMWVQQLAPMVINQLKKK
ncbi:MAG: SGNH/GDSL hydrolase family protein [Mucilaginibacter sp.]